MLQTRDKSSLNRLYQTIIASLVTFMVSPVQAQVSPITSVVLGNRPPRSKELIQSPHKLLDEENSNKLQTTDTRENFKVHQRIIKREMLLQKIRTGGADAGGGGVVYVCFQQKAMPQQVKDLSGALLPEVINLIDSIYVMDVMKAGSSLPFQTPRIQESARSYIDRILDENFAKLNSRFVTRVKNTLDQLMLTWENDAGPQPLLNDFTFHNPWGEFCTPVQVITRYSKIWKENEKTKSSFYVDIDRTLLNKIKTLDPRSEVAVVNEAVLMLHEALYQIATELGQQDSNGTHELLAFLLSQETPQILSTISNPIRYFNMQLSITGFTTDL